MPEMRFTVRWPDGREEACYSPSLVVHDYLTPETDYTVADFVDRSSAALDVASERVRARFGFACTSAMAQKEQLATSSAGFDGAAVVRVLAMEPPLPGAGA